MNAKCKQTRVQRTAGKLQANHKEPATAHLQIRLIKMTNLTQYSSSQGGQRALTKIRKTRLSISPTAPPPSLTHETTQECFTFPPRHKCSVQQDIPEARPKAWGKLLCSHNWATRSDGPLLQVIKCFKMAVLVWRCLTFPLIQRSLYTVLAPYKNASPSLVIHPSTICK